MSWGGDPTKAHSEEETAALETDPKEEGEARTFAIKPAHQFLNPSIFAPPTHAAGV